MLCGITRYGKGTYTAEGIITLCDALKVNTTIKELDISGQPYLSNIGGSDGAKHVADMLLVNGSLTRLDVSQNYLDRGGAGVQLLRDAVHGRKGFVLIDKDNH